MATSLSVKTYLEHLDSKKNTLFKAILTLAVEWKDLDEHLDCTKNCFEESILYLELERSDLESSQNSLLKSKLELESIRESLGLRLEEIESREECFSHFQKEQMEKFERKEEEVSALRRELEVLLERIEREKGEFKEIQKSIGERLREIKSRVKEVEDKTRKLDLAQEWVDTRAKELDLKEEKLKAIEKSNEECFNELRFREEKLNCFEEKSHEIDVKEKRLQERSQCLELKEKQLEELFIDFESKKKQLQDYMKEAQFKEKFHGSESRKEQFKEGNEEVELKSKQFEEQFKDYPLKQTQFEGKPMDFELKSKQIEDQCKDYASKEKQYEDEQDKVLELKNNQIEEPCTDSSSKKKQFAEQFKDFELKKVTKLFKKFELKNKQLDDVSEDISVLATDGKSLQIYLNDHYENHESISSELHKILQVSADPAMLALEAMVGFFPPHLKIGDVEFEMAVVRKSCNFLLSHLIILSPPIHPHVREDALRLACKWKVQMGEFPEDSSVLLAFVQLFASYKLGLELKTNELLGVLELVPLHLPIPELCRFLGLQENIFDIIKKLIENSQHLLALRYIISCGLVNEYPPVPLLKDYLNISMKFSTMRGHLKDNSCEAQDVEIDNGINCIRAVIICIVDNQIESGNWCNTLEEGIRQLQEWKCGKKRIKPFDFNSLLSHITGPFHTESAESTINSTSVFNTLLYSSSNVLKNIRHFNILLSQLLRAPLVVNSEVKKQAMDFLADWKIRMYPEDPLHIWCFLLFVANYEVASSCTKQELLGFLEIVYYRKEGVDLFRSLGLEAEVPNFIRRLVDRGLHLDALDYVYAFDLESTFPPVNFLKGYLSYAKEEGERILKGGNYSIKSQEVAAEIQDKALKAVKNFIILQNLGLENTFGNLKPQNEAGADRPSDPLNCLTEKVDTVDNHVLLDKCRHITEPQVLEPSLNASREKKRKSFDTDQVQPHHAAPFKKLSMFQPRRSQRQSCQQQPL